MRSRNRSLIRIVAVLATTIAWTASDATAQSRSLFGSSSIMSSSGGASNSSSTGSFGSSMGSTAGGFGSTQGGGGSTTSGVGTTALGTTANLGFSQQGMVGTANRSGTGTSGRFIGGNQAGGQQGQSQFGQGGQNRTGQNQFGLGATGQAGRGATGRGRNPNQQNQQNMQGMNQGARGRAGGSNTSTLRPQQRVAFDYAVPPSTETQVVLQNRFNSVRTGPGIKGLNVAFDDGVVTLRGNVDSEESRKLATMLARLEPGVRTVKDELVVQPAGAESR